MPLSFAQPPVDGKTVVTKGLQDIASSSMAAPALGGAPMQAMEPHPVYELGLDDLEAKKGLDAAKLTSWRYLLVVGQNIVQAAEIAGPPLGGSSSQFNSVSDGQTREMEPVLAKAENLPEVVNGNYEIRALRVPGLYVTALWLRDLGGNQDRFLLVPPVFPPFNPNAVYDRGDLLQLLQNEAAKKLAQERKLGFP